MAQRREADLLKAAKRLAKQSGEDCEGWSDEKLELYVYEHSDWESVLEVTWVGGSFAGIDRLGKALYKSFDDAGMYGPYTSFAEARSHLSILDDYDEVSSFWVAEAYKSAV